jgi:hypothetical protein
LQWSGGGFVPTAAETITMDTPKHEYEKTGTRIARIRTVPFGLIRVIRVGRNLTPAPRAGQRHLWTALAERSVDSALEQPGCIESGVALRLPPQSK